MANEPQDFVERALANGVAFIGDDYERIRYEVISPGTDAREQLKSISSESMSGGRSLIARAWLGWIDYRDMYNAVVRSFEFEQQAPVRLASGRQPSAGRLAARFVSNAGPVIAPLLAESFWKPRAESEAWERETCILALDHMVEDNAAMVALLDLAVVLVEDTARERVKTTISATMNPQFENLIRKHIAAGTKGLEDLI